MVVSLKANRKRILAFILLAAIVAGACFFLTGRGEEEARQPIPGGTNEERVAFLESFGWQVQAEPHRDPGGHDSRPVQRCVHRLQRHAAGPGLRSGAYAGQICTQYVYKVENHPGDDQVYATLLVYGDEIIGGDIASTAVDGFMHGFASDSAHFGESGIATATPAATASPQATVAPESSAAESAVGSAPESAAAETAQGTEAAGEPLPEAAYPVD